MQGQYARIFLPPTISDSYPESLIVLINKIENKGIILDWSKVQNLTPSGICMLNCLCDSAGERGVKIKSEYVPKKFKNIPVVKILLKDFSKSLRPIHLLNYDARGVMIRGHENTIPMGFMEEFKIKNSSIQLNEDLEYDCNLILTELMQNSKDHSGAERYFVFLEVKEKEVNIGVLDMGVTIPAKLETKYNYKDDIEALKNAMKDGITTRRSRKGGKGLYYTFKQLEEKKGKLTILSRESQIKRYFQHRTVREKKLKGKLKGTWCFCTIQRDQYENINKK